MQVELKDGMTKFETVSSSGFGKGMKFDLIIVISTFAFLFWWLQRNSTNKNKNFPPGPRSVFGLLAKFSPFIQLKQVEAVSAAPLFKRQFRKIMGFSNCLLRLIFINDLETLKSAFNNPAILGRPPTGHLQMFPDGKPRGIVTTSGETWKELRRFTMSQLKGFGVGQKTLEPVISEQVEECIAILRSKINQPVSTQHFFDILAFNIVWKLVSGQTMSFGDPQAQQLMHALEKVNLSWTQSVLVSTHPGFFNWIFQLFGIKTPFPHFNQLFLKFTSDFVETRLKSKSTLTSSGEHDDFTETFLQKIKSTKDVNSPFYGQLGRTFIKSVKSSTMEIMDENLKATIRDLFLAGSETVGTTLSWALLYLALHPEKQEKLQREIDLVLENRAPALSDRTRMKYTEAVINETLRKSSNLPTALPHAATQEAAFGEFKVPKDTYVIGNFFVIHHCEQTWGDPYVFRPERFLSEDETTLIKHEAFVPFGIGKRMCPGVALAYDELFMFITRIFQEFTVTWNPAEPKPGMRSTMGLTFSPLPHTLIIEERLKPKT